ncbi:MAG: signal peptide peptidase SppA, partial [Verrucomicrobiota bacterium]
MSDQPQKRRGGNGAMFGCLTAGIVLLIVVFGCFGVFFWSFGSAMNEMEAEMVTGPKVAQIDLSGMITSQELASFVGVSESMVDSLSRTIDQAKEDDNVKAVLLRINSPGGEVTASDILYNKVKQLAEEKPVVVYMESVAASGGYYIAAGATEIYANQTTMTGSIGVIISTINYQELFDKVGLKSPTFTSGEYKDTLSGTREMRADEEAMIQQMVNNTYERFLEVVMEGRPDIPEAELRENIADGQDMEGVQVHILEKKAFKMLCSSLKIVESATARH